MVKIATLVTEMAVRKDPTADERVPRFAVVELGARGVGAALAAAGWNPVATVPDLAVVATRSFVSLDVLVVVCTERWLMDPMARTDLDRVAPGVPRVAVVAEEGADAVAYVARLGWHGYAAARPIGVVAATIASVARGELSFPDTAMNALVRTLARVAPLGSAAAASLTPRQRQIVTLLAEGATDSEIAAALQISLSTAHKHVMNARRRLHAKTRSQLVASSRDLASGTDPAGSGRGRGA